MDRNGAKVSPYKSRVTLSKESVSPIGKQTLAFGSL